MSAIDFKHLRTRKTAGGVFGAVGRTANTAVDLTALALIVPAAITGLASYIAGKGLGTIVSADKEDVDIARMKRLSAFVKSDIKSREAELQYAADAAKAKDNKPNARTRPTIANLGL